MNLIVFKNTKNSCFVGYNFAESKQSLNQYFNIQLDLSVLVGII